MQELVEYRLVERGDRGVSEQRGPKAVRSSLWIGCCSWQHGRHEKRTANEKRPRVSGNHASRQSKEDLLPSAELKDS